MDTPPEKSQRRKIYALVDEAIARDLEAIAEKEFRTLTAQVAWILKNYVETTAETQEQRDS